MHLHHKELIYFRSANRNTGWSGGKPTYSSSNSYSQSNMRYPGNTFQNHFI